MAAWRSAFLHNRLPAAPIPALGIRHRAKIVERLDRVLDQIVIDPGRNMSKPSGMERKMVTGATYHDLALRVQPSTCRFCSAYCPVDVTLDGNRVVTVEGNRRAPLFGGFICPKGRALPQLHNDPRRLLTSMKRQADGSYRPIETNLAIAEICMKLADIVARKGPRAVAGFLGNPGVEQIATGPMMMALLHALGSPMFFTMATLDQPGMMIADALHGKWQGGRMRADALGCFVLVGGNPVISKQYFGQNPGLRLKQMVRQGCDLIVIDPRRTETARRAVLHLQIIPGEDPVLIAGILHLLLAGNGYAADFVEANTVGLSKLRTALARFTPDYVAERTGIPETQLRCAANLIGHAERGDTGPGTGASMATRGTLTSYLLLCLNTLRGWWARPGQQCNNSPVLTPPRRVRAQPEAPVQAWGFGAKSRMRGLEETLAGMPAATLAEEILTPGDGQVRALFLHAGAALSVPGQAQIQRALDDLELLVAHDIEMSATARRADYVIASRLGFEVPVITLLAEQVCHIHHGYGWPEPYGAWQPALVEPPAGADVIDAWRLYYRLGQQLGLILRYGAMRGGGGAELDMVHEPTTEALYDLACAGSAVPLSEVRQHRDGMVFAKAREFVGPRDPACIARLQLGDPEMLAELAALGAEDWRARRGTGPDRPYLLIPRRMQNVTNGSYRPEPALPGTDTNPAFMHPDDLAMLGVGAGDLVRLCSRHGEISAVAAADEDLRRGVVAIAHGFGHNLGEAEEPRRNGANVNRLTACDDDFDRRTGMPRMGAIPVNILPQ
jgi:anaerobic selenocysteine-containing dehydrogenase